jgi:hypothetical protein
MLSRLRFSMALLGAAWASAQTASHRAADTTVADATEVELLALGRVADEANPQVPVACVWAAPPLGDPSGDRHAGSQLPVARELLLERAVLKHARTLKPGTGCVGGIGGVREVGTGRPALWVFISPPLLAEGSATIEAGAYCGGKCAWHYRYSLARGDDGRWAVTHEELVSES